LAKESFQESFFDTEYLKMLITAALAPAIARFYGEQRLLEQLQGGG